MSDDLESRLRELERSHDKQAGQLNLMDSRLETILKWTEKKDARAEWVQRAILGLLIAAIVAWILAGNLVNG